MVRTEILESIDSINDSCQDSEIAVIEAMIEEFNKSFTIMENYTGNEIDQFSIIQEGEVLDRVKKESKNDDNKFITIIKFIPRLVIALVDVLKRKFNNSELGEKAKEASKKAEKAKDIKAKKEVVKRLNKEFDGECECYVDEKSGKIKFKKDPKSIIMTIGWLLTTVLNTHELIKKIKAEFDVGNPSKIRSFIDDLDAIIHGDKTVSKRDLFDGGMDAVGDALSHIFTVTGEIALLSGGIEAMADNIIKHDMIKDMPSEKKQAVMKNVNDLAGRITKVNAMIAGAAGTVKEVGKYIGFFDDMFTGISDRKKESYDATNSLADKYIDDHDLKTKNPKGADESDEEYTERLRNIALEEDESISYKSVREEAKRIKKEKKEKEKDEYKKKKQARRNNGSEDKEDDDEGGEE